MSRISDLKRRIRVVIVDDHEVIRSSVRALLESYARFQVCGEGSTGAQAVQLSTGLRPDVVVLNVTMPEMDGFAAARLIRTAHPRCAIVILSSQKDDQIIAYAQSIGVQGFVEKTEAAHELINTIEEAEIGEDFAVAE
jgi:DNA-binding NarL/FixJ family response regulator